MRWVRSSYCCNWWHGRRHRLEHYPIGALIQCHYNGEKEITMRMGSAWGRECFACSTWTGYGEKRWLVALDGAKVEENDCLLEMEEPPKRKEKSTHSAGREREEPSVEIVPGTHRSRRQRVVAALVEAVRSLCSSGSISLLCCDLLMPSTTSDRAEPWQIWGRRKSSTWNMITMVRVAASHPLLHMASIATYVGVDLDEVLPPDCLHEQ
ncbi:hypothetical protein B296_00001287 [Ensete ventricosum]|uniref:Uncharacterized protein n=1 Tax=Ensete ventricosum TaxID=4639 RepID=A0A427B0C9_ENSVE|nr:hypothetical protein B296_00001287 [Ensete ventricosum]